MSSNWRNEDWGNEWILRPTPMVRNLLIANSVVFGMQILFRLQGVESFERYFQLSSQGIRHGWIWQLATYMFLHAGFFHLLFNLAILYFFGIALESMVGSRRFFRIFILGGLAGGALWLAFNWSNSNASVIGASGAICAVLAAFAMLDPDRMITLLIFWVIPVTVRARYLACGLVLVSVLPPMINAGGNIAYLAHLGGAAMGWACAFAIRSGKRWPWEGTPDSSPTSRMDFIEITKQDESMQRRVDPILDKIAEHGIQSLTQEERRLLDSVKDRTN